MFGAWIWKILRIFLKGFGTIRQKIRHFDFLLHRLMFHDKKIEEILQENDVPLLHRAACKEFVSLVQKAFRDSCNRHLVLYLVKPNPSTPCKRQWSSDSSTSDFASPSPEPEDIEVDRRGIPTRGRSGSIPIEI